MLASMKLCNSRHRSRKGNLFCNLYARPLKQTKILDSKSPTTGRPVVAQFECDTSLLRPRSIYKTAYPPRLKTYSTQSPGVQHRNSVGLVAQTCWRLVISITTEGGTYQNQ